MALIFLPGISTPEKVSDVSGRGVGMDVVKTNLDKLGGKIEIESAPGKGTWIFVKPIRARRPRPSIGNRLRRDSGRWESRLPPTLNSETRTCYESTMAGMRWFRAPRSCFACVLAHSLLVTATLGMLLSRSITKPLHASVTHLDKVVGGDVSRDVPQATEPCR